MSGARFAAWLAGAAIVLAVLPAQDDTRTVRVFVFAGQSNMVGADADPAEIAQFPPFAELAAPQPKVRYWYVIGREEKRSSSGWTALQPVDGTVGPELSFAREVTNRTKAPVAIVKVAAGGTTLGKDWNPDQPAGFELYPLALATVRAALADLTARRVPWRLEGFVWHQGENDMFDEAFRKAYADNLAHFIACWRRDLQAPQLPFYLGELCTKTIWGMDHRVPMQEIALAQQKVAEADAAVDYVRTSHVAVKIGHPVGLHYHYGTLGQLEHGVEHAHAYLRRIGKWQPVARPLRAWPYAAGAAVDLYVLAGHRNMEGERAFTAALANVPNGKALAKDRQDVAWRHSTSGGVQTSQDWEPLGPAGLYDTFGPELSFGRALAQARKTPFALAKFTHGGSQIVDWTPEGSAAHGRDLQQPFVAFVRDAIADLERRGHRVQLRGIVYHLGENDMSFGPHRRQAATWLGQMIAASRKDLGMPTLRWFVSRQRPTDHADVNAIDVDAAIRALAAADRDLVLVDAFDPPPQREALVFDAAGIVWLGERLAAAVQKAER